LEGARRERDDGDGVARCVEELNRAAFFSDSTHDVPLHERADVAGAQTGFADATGQDHPLCKSRAMSYLGSW
jgi:hypothetical protein